ncbi:MAG: SEC-C domain-containing protein [Desulfovibrionaceae bacterium]|jgi:SEC-C motif-containing protein|nr:SEC-C domain-containing protein [Desulfovibrionaceae bacterium]
MSDHGPETPCPCGSGKTFGECCQPYLEDTLPAPTAEALMRARYTAYVTGHIPYLGRTLALKKRRGFDTASARDWSENAVWQGLEILDVKRGGPEDRRGEVEFIARYEMHGQAEELHERSRFERVSGRWFYVDGVMKSERPAPAGETVVRDAPKTGRNDPCPCGSGKKYKKCCGA